MVIIINNINDDRNSNVPTTTIVGVADLWYTEGMEEESRMWLLGVGGSPKDVTQR